MKNVNAKTFWLCIFAGIIIRFVLMSLGHNFDFNSYCIVGELAAAGKNIYANTPRYNYGPVWFMLLGLFWRAASCFTHNIVVFRCFVVGTLTLGDFFMTLLISKKTGNVWGAVFFLNPISLIITGYHNQFDNLAVLIGALAVICIEKSCTEHDIKPEDIYGTLLLSLSLITKHILWAFPLWILLNTNINLRKKFLYAFVPVILFLMSFAPYWQEGAHGIINNVFMYASLNNFPLFAVRILEYFGLSFPIQEYIYLPVFGLLMLAGAYVFRHEDVAHSFLLYTISLVCFSSAITNQYLAIPCMAVILLCKVKSMPYILMSLVYLSCDRNGLHIPLWLNKHLNIGISLPVKFISAGGVMYTVLAWLLLYCLVDYCRKDISR